MLLGRFQIYILISVLRAIGLPVDLFVGSVLKELVAHVLLLGQRYLHMK